MRKSNEKQAIFQDLAYFWGQMAGKAESKIKIKLMFENKYSKVFPFFFGYSKISDNFATSKYS